MADLSTIQGQEASFVGRTTDKMLLMIGAIGHIHVCEGVRPKPND